MAVTVICSLFVSSCETVETAEMQVALSESEVSYVKGNVFINVRCSGEWALYLVTPEGGEVDWASIEEGGGTGTGDKSLIVLYYDKNKGEKSRTLKVVLDNGTDWKECLLVQKAEPVEPDDPDDKDPVVGDGLAKTGWLELPAMDDPDLEYYSHSFSMNGKTYRNYSFGYNKGHYLAEWVAYPLCSMYTYGSAGSSSWMANPLFSSNDQPNFKKSFGFSRGYERGHQIANADRRCCYEANQQTYYYTNATLQRDEFNGDIWATLEGNLRNVAKQADTLYVVTGCVVGPNPTYISDYDGRRVPIPSGYFKAALRYGKVSSVGQWLGAAFYLEHKIYPYTTIKETEAMSIDELETKLGMDFFVNLEAKIGKEAADRIEAQDPLAYKTTWYIQ